jgi:hypothetical protein
MLPDRCLRARLRVLPLFLAVLVPALGQAQAASSSTSRPKGAPAPAQPPRAPSKGNEFQTYLNAAMRLYESLEYEQALQRLSRARRHAQGVEDDVIISLYEGIIHADMGRKEQARASFRDGLLLRPDANLPVKVSPKVARDFEAVRQDVRRELAALHAKQEAQREQAAPPQPPPITPTSEEPPPVAPTAAEPPPAAPTAAEPPPVAPTAAEPPPVREAGSLRLRPEVFGFVAPLGETSHGLGAGLSFGSGSMEAGVRVLLGEDVGVGVEAGLLLGSGKVQPRLGLRGTVVPGQPSYGGGAVVGLRLRPVSRLTFLVDVGAEYFAVPNGFRSFVLTSSAGVGFDLL